MSWTTKSYDELLVVLSKTQQERARLEGEVEQLKQTVTLLKAALGELAREEANGRLKARVVELEARLSSVLERATAPATVVPGLFGNGPGR